MSDERDKTFEALIFKWYQKRRREVAQDPNHAEFQARVDELERFFGAMLEAKFSLLSDDGKRIVASAFEDSLEGSITPSSRLPSDYETVNR